MKRLISFLCMFAALLVVFSAAGCSAVFNGGINGTIVDSESTQTPKEGIAGVQVYAYTDVKQRDSDFKAWDGKSTFKPASGNYAASGITNGNGNYSLSGIFWETKDSKFGKTGDYKQIYLLYYSEKYGLVKNTSPALVISDNSANTVYEELTKIYSTTEITVNLKNTSSDNAINIPLNVEITVPQKQGNRVYSQTITGTGRISVSYPRYKDDGTDSEPNISINVWDSSDKVRYKMSYYKNEYPNLKASGKDYAFLPASETVQKTIKGSTYNTTVYLKPTLINLPPINGRILNQSPAIPSTPPTIGSPDDDNVLVELLDENGNPWDQTNLTQVYTRSSGNGANSSIVTHGLFSDLGNGLTFYKDDYDEKSLSFNVQIKVNGSTTLPEQFTVDCGKNYFDAGVIEWQ
ncbi:MAG: hypothetical protein MJ183_04730 [Treponemataceae bacterium]|nr:hypothetical protein [Treponemataceae bacterium]